MNRSIFIDTADIDEIKLWQKRLNIEGVTTNQKIFLSQKSKNFKNTVLAICNRAKSPVSIELTTHDSVDEMVKEAKLYAKWHKFVVVKVPMTMDGFGLETIKILSKLKIKTNATVMMSFEQMLMAINVKADYVSLFLNRSKDSGYDALQILKRTRRFIDEGGYKSRIIAGSIRKTTDVGDAFENGADIVTVPPNILSEMLMEDMTQKTIEEFDEAWKSFMKQK